jgi:hypothetical protein
MDSIPLALQTAVAAVGIIGTGGTITFAILSHRTASRALKLTEASIKLNEESQKFAHEERIAALRNTLHGKQLEIYDEFVRLAMTAQMSLKSLGDGFRMFIDHKKQIPRPSDEDIQILKDEVDRRWDNYKSSHELLLACNLRLYALASEEVWLKASDFLKALGKAGRFYGNTASISENHLEESQLAVSDLTAALDGICKEVRRDLSVSALSRERRAIAKFDPEAEPFDMEVFHAHFEN